MVLDNEGTRSKFLDLDHLIDNVERGPIHPRHQQPHMYTMPPTGQPVRRSRLEAKRQLNVCR